MIGYYVSLAVVCAVAASTLMVQIWKKYGRRNYIYFRYLMVAVVIWSITILFELFSHQEHIKVFYSQLSYFGIAPLPALWFLFSLEYSQKIKNISKKQVALIFLIPAITILLAVTSHMHQILWFHIEVSHYVEGYSFMLYQRGVWFFVNSLYAYIMLGYGVATIVRYLLGNRIFRDFLFILPALAMPILSNLLYLTRTIFIDFTPIAFSFTCIWFSWGILNGFFEKKMVLADRVIKNMEEGVISLDEQFRITWMNPYAERILDVECIAENAPANEVLPFFNQLASKLRDDSDVLLEVSMGTPKRWYIVHTYPVHRKEKYPGWLLIFFDVTQRKQIEQQLLLRDRLMTATASATGMLLEEADTMRAVLSGLSLLGKASHTDRAGVFFKTEIDQEVFVQRKLEWNACEQGISSELILTLEEISEIIDILIQGKEYVYSASDIQSVKTRCLFTRHGIQSALFLPIIIRNLFWGFISFEVLGREKAWLEAEISILRTYTGSVSHAIERAMTENELKAERIRAEAASVAKDQFLANMSHEIRTPMNAMIGFLELLSETEMSEEQQSFLKEVNTASEGLLYLINDILDYSKFEAHSVELETIPFNLRVLVEDAARLNSPRAHGKNIELFSLVYSKVPEYVQGDPGRLRQVLNNLIGNAIKFTDQGEVLVKTEMIDEQEGMCNLKISVCDTGIGISTEVIPKLFQVFTQADASTTRKYGGTGLGLAISKKIIEAMGGTIEVNSQEGKGSEFMVSLKLVKSDIPYHINHTEPLTGLKVLIVDDHQTNRYILKEYLQDHEVYEAASGEEALKILEQAEIQLVIVDHHMPMMSGMEVAQKIRQASKQSVKMLLLTSAGQRGDVRKAIECGFDAYLTKPIRKKELVDCIHTLFNPNASYEKKPTVTRHTLREEKFKKTERILLVEDNEANRRLMMVLFNKMGVGYDTAVNGKEAVEACSRTTYHLILMDCQMPVMDGFEATRHIKAENGQNSKTPIVALTANAMEEDRERCLKAGMDDYMAKPVSGQKLKEMIQKYMP